MSEFKTRCFHPKSAYQAQFQCFDIEPWGTGGLNGPMDYVVRRVQKDSGEVQTADWDAPHWRNAQTLEVRNFRPEGSDHRPQTQSRLLYDASGIHGIFRVHDRYVRCQRTKYFDEVWKDSCVEFFAEPQPGCGYVNFEFNCGGAFLCSHIIDPERTPHGFKVFTKIPEEIASGVRVKSSLPKTIEPEITEPVIWTLSFFIPLTLFEYCFGKPRELRGQAWRGNFFKCAEENSHPHWASWAPVDEFNFHRPNCFRTIRFE